MTAWIAGTEETSHWPNGRWVKCVAVIRKNDTGETRRYATETILEDREAHPSVYGWEEGNYSCDCNRELFFGYAVGKKYEDAPNRECTNGRYSVNLENPATGETYYREFCEQPNT